MAMVFRRCLLVAFALVCGVQAQAQTQTQPPELVVGVRADAPPFSYRTGRGVADYSGYMVEVCTRVLNRLRATQEFRLRFEPVAPAERFSSLSAGTINILCDPATIDQDRLQLPNVMVSQPIYLSGIGMAGAARRDAWVAHWPCIGAIVGVVEGTTSRSNVIEDMAREDRFGVSFGEKIFQHPDVDKVVLTDLETDQFSRCGEKAGLDGVDPALLTTASTPGPVIKSFLNHSDLARAVCAQTVMYSVGDLEIIAAALKAAQRDDPDCRFDIDPKVASEERYGIFVHVSDAVAPADKVTLAFLRQLSIEIHKGRESVLVSSFRNNFDVEKLSHTLDLFFWNVIAGGK